MEADRWGVARRNGGVILGIGSLFLVGNLITIQMAGSFGPKFNILGLGLMGMGLGLLLVPGPKISKSEVPAPTQELFFLWERTVVWRKVIWGALMVVGLFAGLQLNLFWGGELI